MVVNTTVIYPSEIIPTAFLRNCPQLCIKSRLLADYRADKKFKNEPRQLVSNQTDPFVNKDSLRADLAPPSGVIRR